MASLQSRFTRATIAVLILFSLLLAGVLDRVFKRTLINSEENRLKGIVYTFLSAMDVELDGNVKIEQSTLPNTISDAKDLSIAIVNDSNNVLWTMGQTPPADILNKIPNTGEWIFEHLPSQNDSMRIKFGLTWEGDHPGAKEWKYTLIVTDSGYFYQSEMRIFHNKLWTWLLLGCCGLLLLQLLLLRWGFRPLKQIANEVEMIEKGKQHKFENQYPSELSQLTTNINSLLRHERGQQIRYQQALDNLAHALKTPLTAIKNLTMQTPNQQLLKDLDEQVLRAKDIVDYQLRKAAAVGKSPFAKPILVGDVVEKISRSIQKVYSQKNIQLNIQIPNDLFVQMDEGDLFEIVGNVLENAAKYCKSKIKITASNLDHVDLMIEDDGPGFNDQQIQSLVQRGVRQDQRTEGSGIGLSVAYEIISVFGGSLELSRSTLLGGALVKIHFS